MSLDRLIGQHLGTRTVSYTAENAALYALAVGAEPGQLELVYERDLTPLPTYAAALGMWATAAAAVAGGYDEVDVLHAAQEIELLGRLPAHATIEMSASVPAVYDKGSAAIVEVVVEAALFRATYSMFVRGGGGWGGDRGPSAPRGADGGDLQRHDWLPIDRKAAALYRLTGDPHPVHIDPETARATGLRAPILHGLCTFGTVTRAAAEAAGRSALGVTRAQCRFLAPVYPGDTLGLATAHADNHLSFTADVAGAKVLTGSATIDRAS